MSTHSRKMLEMELPRRRKGEEPKRRFLNVLKENMELGGVPEEDAGDKVRWKQMIRRGKPQRERGED